MMNRYYNASSMVFRDAVESLLTEYNGKFYLENFRYKVDLSSVSAGVILRDMAQVGIITVKYEIHCRSCKRSLLTINNLNELPLKVKCDVCEMIDSENNYEFMAHEGDTMKIYCEPAL